MGRACGGGWWRHSIAGAFTAEHSPDGQLTVLRARALLVDGRRIGLYGGYGSEHDRLVLAEIRDDTLAGVATYRLVLPDGGRMPSVDSDPYSTDLHVIGRGRELHVFHGTRWYSLNLADLLSG